MTRGCLPKRLGGPELRDELLDLDPQGEILDDQLVRLENLGFVLETGRSVAVCAAGELGRDSIERGKRVAFLGRRLSVVPDEGAPDRDPAGGGETTELALAHFPAETVLARAPRIRVVEVAPGSW